MQTVKTGRAWMRGGAALALACAAGAFAAVPGAGAAARLMEQYPGVHLSEYQGMPSQFYGQTMNIAATPDDAVAGWLRDHGAALGVGNIDLQRDVRLLQAFDVSFGKFTVYHYQQQLDGLPVEVGALTLLVRNFAGATPGTVDHGVVLVGSRMTAPPAEGFAAIALSDDDAVARAKARREFADLVGWSKPELVVFFGEGDLDQRITPTHAWKFSAENYADAGNPRRFTFFVDAATGTILHARNEILNIDVTGRVEGLSSPNNTAHHAGNPPVIMTLPDIKVTNTATGVFAYTDANGNFTLPNAGTAPVNLLVTTNDGRWARANNTVGANISVTQSATPGTPAIINVNPAHTEETTAQVNAYIHQTATHNFVKSRAPGFVALDTALPANVQVAGTCNAFYNGNSTNYYPVGGGCNNTAFSSVVNHEYGHHIVNQRGMLAQGAFGEGFGDVMSILINDDPVIGRFFRTSGAPVRDVNDPADIRSYPCSGTEVHFCGEIIGNVMWLLREQFVTRYGTATGLTNLRQLAMDWVQMTHGGQGNNSAHPDMLIEWLVADDDNGNLCDGTPNYAQITAAFGARNILQPTTLFLGVTGVALPTELSVSAPTRVTVRVTNCRSTFTLAGSTAVYSINGGADVSVPLTAGPGAGEYSANIPAVPCPSAINYSFRLQSSTGVIAWPAFNGTTLPISAQGGSAFVATAFENGAEGWSVGPDTAVRGNWQLGDPEATAAQTGDDATPGAGVNCWVTGLAAGTGIGSFDVDDGQTILTSPAFNLVGRAGLVVAYKRWYSTGAGALPYADVLRVQVSTNNGATWTDAEVVGPADGPDTNPGWRDGGFSFAALGITPTAQTRVRFIAEDVVGQGSLVEAAIDDFSIRDALCGATSGCDSIDFNGDGVSPDSQDITDFLAVFAGGACSTLTCGDIDFNNDGVSPDSGDISALLSAFGGGPCP